MANRCTIGKLAREAEIPVSTVRYYERRRLLSADARSQGNYRLYGPESLERLRFVRSAQSAGFTLSDICALLEFRDGDVEPCCKVQLLIEQRLGHVRAEQTRLQEVEKLLGRWLRTCQTARRSDRCGVLEVLENSSKKRRVRISSRRP